MVDEHDPYARNPVRRFIVLGDERSRAVVESLSDDQLLGCTKNLLESLLRAVNDVEDGEFLRLAVVAASALEVLLCPQVGDGTVEALPRARRSALDDS